MPRPAATPGIHYKLQGHAGHDKKDPSETAGFIYNSDPPTSGMHFERFSETLISDPICCGDKRRKPSINSAASTLL